MLVQKKQVIQQESLYNYFQKVASESLSGESLNEPLGEQQDITFTAKQFAKEPER